MNEDWTFGGRNRVLPWVTMSEKITDLEAQLQTTLCTIMLTFFIVDRNFGVYGDQKCPQVALIGKYQDVNIEQPGYSEEH